MLCHLVNSNKTYFNPRSHEGSDEKEPIVVFAAYNFNPRSHEGSDTVEDVSFKSVIISILAPTRGATNSICYTTHKV